MNGRFPFYTPAEKTCANCKHAQFDTFNTYCGKFSKDEPRWEPVQGPYRYVNKVTAFDARHAEYQCGTGGKHFEPSRWARIKKGWARFPKGVTAAPIGLALGLLLSWLAHIWG
ncbi:endolysin [Ralstonia phage RpT1]|nr:endolysin [Ralstonia phage RpT1]